MTLEIIDLGPRYAFVRKQEDGTWCAVIVGHTERHLPDSGTAEALDWNILPDEASANSWVAEMIGPSEKVSLLN